ncbi:unnamed protein product [Musa banksii]
MAGTSSYSSSPCASLGSLDDVSVKPTRAIKFLCSYGGKILPRYPDGKLRYVGGHTRLLAVDRSISFSELQVKLRELCGWGAVSLRCQLPTEDLDALISVTSDEDLANLVEEYDIASRDRPSPLKIRAFLFLTPPPKLVLPSLSPQAGLRSSPPSAASTGSPCRQSCIAGTECPPHRPPWDILASTAATTIAMAAQEHAAISCITGATCNRYLWKKKEQFKVKVEENNK